MKKRLLIIVIVGITCFAGTFIAARLTPKSASANTADSEQNSTGLIPNTSIQFDSSQSMASPKLSMAESELRSLIFDLREKSNDYDRKFEELETDALQTQTLREQLSEDIEKLLELQIELAETITSIKTEQKRLEETRIRIGEEEKRNLVSIAATYDKMEAAAASKILINMTQTSSSAPAAIESIENAIKILYFMGDRTKGELLAEMAKTQPQLAALFTNKLKEISNSTEG